MIRKITLLVALFAMTIGTAQNLAEGKTTAASTDVKGASGSAVDGNMGTRWESDFEDPQWWSVDLGASYDIGQIIIHWQNARGSDYTIEISSDNSSWTTIHTEVGGSGTTDDLSVSGTGRYIRYYGTSRATPYGHSFWEFQVYEYVDPTIDASLSDLTVNGVTVTDFLATEFTYDIELTAGTTVVPTVVGTPTQGTASAVTTNAGSLPGTSTVLVTAQDGTTTQTYTLNFTVDKINIAEGKTGTASSIEGSYTADKAFDGNSGTRWASAWESLPGWIYVDLEAIYEVSGVNLTWNTANSYGVQYTIEVSDDASSWTTVFTEDHTGDPYSQVDDISFTAENARYVRMHGTETPNIYGFSLLEFEVYGTYFGEVVGIDKIEDLSFSVYPNPTTGVVNIQTDGTIENVEVFDISGRSLVQTESNTIDIQNLSNGVYILKVTVDGVVKTTKIIKQ